MDGGRDCVVELRQQVETLRREPLEIDKVYRNGKAVGLVGRNRNSAVHVFKRYAASEAASLLEAVNDAREVQGLYGPCVGILQPKSAKRLQELRKRLNNER